MPPLEDSFAYDVFLSHSAKDQAVMRPLAERLWADGVKHSAFGFRHSDFGFSPPCLSAHAFGSNWAQWESGTLRTGQRPFRDPLNKERRFLPLRLDDAPTNDSDPFRKDDDVRWQFANRTQSRTLATLRDTLLPKLLSGELRIRDSRDTTRSNQIAEAVPA